jgi:hypothetical protein
MVNVKDQTDKEHISIHFGLTNVKDEASTMTKNHKAHSEANKINQTPV